MKTLSPITVGTARERGLDCSIVLFYVFGASYPDGSCHEGRLTDDDDDYITEDGPPCPFCNPAAYAEWSEDGSFVLVEQLGAARASGEGRGSDGAEGLPTER